MNDSSHFPLPDNDMPPLPEVGEYGPVVCSTVRLYLAIVDDLPPEQVQTVIEHVRTCPDCAKVQRQMQQTTWALADLPGSTPSPRVDQAVLAAIAARSNRQTPTSAQIGQSYIHDQTPAYATGARKRRSSMVGASFAGTLTLSGGQGIGSVPKSRALKPSVLASIGLAAVLILAFLATMHFMGGSTTQAFTLPAHLSWNGYVLYHSESRIDAHGVRYSVDCYHDLSTGRMHVETVMPGRLDVVAVGDDHAMLGLDMMHHVAQWGANAWSVDETAFNLAQLRSDLETHRAVYLDKDMFRGQPVYRIRSSNGLVLLLDMHYHPVNVLRGAVGPGTGGPVYNSLMLMPASHVSSSMWDMSVPGGFRMGALPEKP